MFQNNSPSDWGEREKEISPRDGNFRRERERERNRQREAFPPASPRDRISVARERGYAGERERYAGEEEIKEEKERVR